MNEFTIAEKCNNCPYQSECGSEFTQSLIASELDREDALVFMDEKSDEAKLYVSSVDASKAEQELIMIRQVLADNLDGEEELRREIQSRGNKLSENCSGTIEVPVSRDGGKFVVYLCSSREVGTVDVDGQRTVTAYLREIVE